MSILKKGLIIAVVIPFLLLAFKFWKINCVKERRNSYILSWQDNRRDYLDQNFNSYKDIYDGAVNYIQQSINNTSSNTISLIGSDWQIDSLLAFTEDSSRFYSMLLNSNKLWKNLKLDNVNPICGANISGNWYYFKANEISFFNRGTYKRDPYERLSTDELSYLATGGYFNYLLIKQEDGSYHSNNKWLEAKFYHTKNKPCTNPENIRICKDSLIATKVKSFKNVANVEKYRKMEAKMRASTRPHVDMAEDRSLLHKIFFYEHVPLFESEEWVNRNNRTNK